MYCVPLSEQLAGEKRGQLRCIVRYFRKLETESLDIHSWYVYNRVDMTGRRRSDDDPKVAVLRAAGALHSHPESVQDEAFQHEAFFDRRDKVQVKYEMLRRHRIDGRPVTEVAASFGVSRQAFYTTDAAFDTQGIVGLLPRRKGPKRAHKCTDEILDFAEQWRDEPDESTSMAKAVERRFGVSIHPRSLLRALARREKKRRRRRAKSSR